MPFVSVQPQPFDLAFEYAAIQGTVSSLGGVGCFVGRVRGADGLLALTLEHYPGMTERVIAEMIDRTIQRFDLLDCRVIHRIGRLQPGEDIVLVLAASRHRTEALDATRFLIDWLKTDAPFWKLEEFASGDRRWVAPRHTDIAARDAWAP